MKILIPDNKGEFPPLNENSPWIEIERRMRKKTIIDPITGCWLFSGALTKAGYGVIRTNGRNLYVHRVSAAIYLDYELFDSEHQVNHKDICLHTNCWWYEHLYIGTQAENIHDSIMNGLHVSVIELQKTHCPQGHPYNEENTIIDKEGHRYCRVCRAEAQRRYQNTHRK